MLPPISVSVASAIEIGTPHASRSHSGCAINRRRMNTCMMSNSGFVIELSEYISSVLVVAKLNTEVPYRRNTRAPSSTRSLSSQGGSRSNSSNSAIIDGGGSSIDSSPRSSAWSSSRRPSFAPRVIYTSSTNASATGSES
jgi:hypothetical protein